MVAFLETDIICKMTPEKETALNWIYDNRMVYELIAKFLWDHPELGLVEFKSAAKLEKLLADNKFKIEKGISGMPTAFVASWGTGDPVIGFLAEYDALPNLSQKSEVTKPDPIVAGAPGHGCGHNLLGTSDCIAAIATSVAMEKHGIEGTVKVFGTPAEETLMGKVFMARDNVFHGTDVMITWHPADTNGVDYKSMVALTSAKFEFSGISVHDGLTPEAGRSALDAVELMSIGMNYMRGHVIQEARIMHIISKGGDVPNMVPPDAEVWYYIRAPRRFQVDQMWNWMLDVAKGAALMTQTRLNHKLLSATWELLPNRVLAKVGDANASMIGPPKFTAKEQKFGEEIIKSLGRIPTGTAFDESLIHPDFSKTFPNVECFGAASDRANVSWMFPTLSFRAATKAFGTPQHSWQMVSQTISSPALKAGLKAAEWMATTALDCFVHPEIISEAWKEHTQYLAETSFYHPVPEDIKVPTFKDLYGIEPDLVPKLPQKDGDEL